MKACPTGWHLPFKVEWEKLFLFADSTYAPGKLSNEGKYLKAKSGWDKQHDGKSGNGTDKFGFSALPGGYVGAGSFFYGVGNKGFWWSATDNLSFYLDIYNDKAYSGGGGGDNPFYSVRCIKD